MNNFDTNKVKSTPSSVRHASRREYKSDVHLNHDEIALMLQVIIQDQGFLLKIYKYVERCFERMVSIAGNMMQSSESIKASI